MPELTLNSAGVSAREVDLTGPTSIEPTGTPAGIISTTEKGPAFVPMIQPTQNDYRVRFGNPVDNIKFGPLSAMEWLRNQQSLVQLRVLGAGNGLQRSASGANAGKVASAGFIVGDEQPQTSLDGGLDANSYANESSSGPTAHGSLGRTYFLGCYMSQSVNSTFFTDAGLTQDGTSAPIVRGVLLAASGVILTLSSSKSTSTVPSQAKAASFTAGTVNGWFTGSLNLGASKQEFVMFLNGHKGTLSQYPNYYTASFDTTAPNYFTSVFNQDPLKLEEAGHVLYASYDIVPAVAVPTGSGIVQGQSGSSVLGNGYEDIAFLAHGSSATHNSGTVSIPNYEGFEDRYATASTPWFISQNFGGTTINLFKVWSLSDGEIGNTQVKISIENLTPSNNTNNLYGTFDLVVRNYFDTDGNKVVLETWRGLTLDPTSPRYIAKIIGDYNTKFNFDTDESSQKLETTGEFSNNSRYIRVEMSDTVVSGESPEVSLPVGFRGPGFIATSGSLVTGSSTDSDYYTKSNPLNDIVQMPVPYRTNITRGTSSSQTADRTLYWGVQFEKVLNPSEPNASNIRNSTIDSFVKYFPNYQTVWANVFVTNNEGAANSATQGILDNDRFNNNQFSLEKIKIKYNSTTLLPDLTNLKDWVYVRAGGIATDSGASTRALSVSDLSDPSTRGIAKFTVFLNGGFDGVRIFNKDAKYLTNNAIVEEMNNSTRGYSNGPTVKSYLKAIDIIKDTTEIDIQLLTIPGIRNRYVTDYASLAVENDRFDCLYIMDIEEKDSLNELVTSTITQSTSVRFTANDFRNRALNTSFVATYFPDVILADRINGVTEKVPPSVAVLGAFAKNDSIGHPWFAPAGFARGTLETVQEASIPLSRANLDSLYSVNINPIVAFPGQGPTVWGQKTCLNSQSALERVNVRRLLISLRREVKKVSNLVMFEPLREDTLARFSTLVNPILKTVQEQGGLDNYKVVINTETTTQADIDNKTIKGKIFVIPTRTVEFISLDFALTNRGNF